MTRMIEQMPALDVWVEGTGRPVLLLHRDIGRGERGEFIERLAEKYTVYVPVIPGFDGSERPSWMRTVTDVARQLTRQLLEAGEPPTVLLGLGFGGWVAAEMLALQPYMFDGIVLHAPMGILADGFGVVDQFLIAAADYVRLGFSSDAEFQSCFGADLVDRLRGWDRNREATTQVAWKPYMHSRALAPLLQGLPVPCSIILSGGDRVVPRETSLRYCEILPNNDVTEMANIGHLAEFESPSVFADVILDSLDRVCAAVK